MRLPIVLHQPLSRGCARSGVDNMLFVSYVETDYAEFTCYVTCVTTTTTTTTNTTTTVSTATTTTTTTTTIHSKRLCELWLSRGQRVPADADHLPEVHRGDLGVAGGQTKPALNSVG